jgi:hypothetical protein
MEKSRLGVSTWEIELLLRRPEKEPVFMTASRSLAASTWKPKALSTPDNEPSAAVAGHFSEL